MSYVCPYCKQIAPCFSGGLPEVSSEDEALVDSLIRDRTKDMEVLSVVTKDQCKAEKLELLDKAIKMIPTNWIDPLLTGENKVLPDGYSYDPKDIERLLLAVKSRIEKLREELEGGEQ